MPDEETAIVEARPEPAEEFSVHLVARNPKEMAAAKSSMEEWLSNKRDACNKEADDLFKAYETAKKNKWNTVALLRHYNVARKREQFYAKALSVVKAGYTLVPNFPVDLFAMRVKREVPVTVSDTSSWGNPNPVIPQPVSIPIGEGRYVSADTVLVQRGDYEETKKDGSKETKHWVTTTGYSDVEFPLVAAVPEVMTATQEAMVLKVFDAIGICPPRRKGDPLIIGQVRMPKVGWADPKVLSFLIAWHLDLRTL